MSANNGSADGDHSPQTPKLYDLSRLGQSEPEINSSSSDDLSELQSSMESMLTNELEEEEMENGVQQPIRNENMVLEFEITVPSVEFGNPTYQAAALPPPPPPSPTSLVSTESPNSRDPGEVCSGESVPNLVVMGCVRCYLYVMVSDCDPKCPKCGSYDLIDEFQGEFGPCKRRRN